MTSGRIIALFDFDGTLTRRDTLLPFLRYCAGTLGFLRRMTSQSPWLLGLILGLLPNDVVKQRVLRAFFEGLPIDEIRYLGRSFAQEVLPGLLRPSSMDFLRWHLDRGHRCFLVSASLDVYLKPWSDLNGFDGALCSHLEVSPSGRVTGRLEGRNVFGEEKMARVRRAIPDELSLIEYAYGDSRGDREMLALARYAWFRGAFQGETPAGWLER